MSGDVGSTDGWQPARLIPTSGIHGAEEAEKRATSALLAVMTSVKEFGAAILRPLGAPAGPVEAFIEVPSLLGESTVCPDGLISTTRGGKTWTIPVGKYLVDKPGAESGNTRATRGRRGPSLPRLPAAERPR